MPSGMEKPARRWLAAARCAVPQVRVVYAPAAPAPPGSHRTRSQCDRPGGVYTLHVLQYLVTAWSPPPHCAQQNVVCVTRRRDLSPRRSSFAAHFHPNPNPALHPLHLNIVCNPSAARRHPRRPRRRRPSPPPPTSPP
eukprot:scaffold9168_cov43-Phaeocystis_antarctica.AAC.1